MSDAIYTEFIPKRFRPNTERIIARADSIIEEYAAQGYDLTLRQLYYQFVARGLVENSQKSYDSLGAIISDARLAGRIPWNRITDRTRNVKGGGGYDSPDQLISYLRWQYRRDKWENQPNFVEVWVEKEALANVVERACSSLNLPWFCCRGYVSQSEMYAAGTRFSNAQQEGRDLHIIHLGDHDPSGIDMSRDIEERVNMFVTGNAQWREEEGAPVTIHRIALNMPQVRQFRPPPNPAKTTDARFKTYEYEYGKESWELDALDPSTLEGLIDAEVRELIEPDAWEESERREREESQLLRAVSQRWSEVRALLRGDL